MEDDPGTHTPPNSGDHCSQHRWPLNRGCTRGLPTAGQARPSGTWHRVCSFAPSSGCKRMQKRYVDTSSKTPGGGSTWRWSVEWSLSTNEKWNTRLSTCWDALCGILHLRFFITISLLLVIPFFAWTIHCLHWFKLSTDIGVTYAYFDVSSTVIHIFFIIIVIIIIVPLLQIL